MRTQVTSKWVCFFSGTLGMTSLEEEADPDRAVAVTTPARQLRLWSALAFIPDTHTTHHTPAPLGTAHLLCQVVVLVVVAVVCGYCLYRRRRRRREGQSHGADTTYAHRLDDDYGESVFMTGTTR